MTSFAPFLPSAFSTFVSDLVSPDFYRSDSSPDVSCPDLSSPDLSSPDISSPDLSSPDIVDSLLSSFESVLIISSLEQLTKSSSVLSSTDVLLDSGANCHIISTSLMKFLNLTPTPSSTSVSIKTADSSTSLKSSGIVELGGFIVFSITACTLINLLFLFHFFSVPGFLFFSLRALPLSQ